MIETVIDCDQFRLENIDGDWIVHAVPVEDSAHPSNNSISILFIRNTSTGRTYYFAFDHPDSKPKVDKKYFVDEYLMEPTKIKWALDKKSFRQLLDLPNLHDANICNFMKHNEIDELSEFETPTHTLVRRNSEGLGGINKSIPLMKHLEMFDDVCDSVEKAKKKVVLDSAFLSVDGIILETLSDIESNGIYVDASIFEKHFHQKPNPHGFVFSQYNLYTSTGRPSNRFNGVNYAALNHSDGSRSAFISRHGNDGRMVVIDYTAFHPRIICSLTGYSISTDIDIYEYLAKLYFQKKIVDDTDIANAKQLTFRQLYGGVEDKYSHIKYLTNLKSFIDEQWELFQKDGYVLTPVFKRKITDKHIKEPNPTKVFNYILQAAEGEIAIPRVAKVLTYLRDKKTKAVLYTYDAVLYDFHKEDGVETLLEIQRIMSFDRQYPMKTYIGNSYQDIKLANF